MLKPLIYLLLILIFFESCDCRQQAQGIILDKKTKKPIDSVYVHKLGEQQGEYSDSTGSYKISEIDGGIFGCPVLKLAFYKIGYKTIEDDGNQLDTIYMTSDITPNKYPITHQANQ